MPLQSLVKALWNVLHEEESEGYPDLTELIAEVESYQQRYPKQNPTNSQKIRHILDEIYEKTPFNNTRRRILWLAVLKTVIPLLILDRQAVGEWWDQIFFPFLNSPTQLKPVFSDLKSILFYILIFHDEDEWGGDLRRECAEETITRLVDLYVSKAIENLGDVESQEQRNQTIECLVNVLVHYGIQRPKELSSCFCHHFLNPPTRIPILSVMVEVIRRQGPRLYEIPQTGFYDLVLKCAEFDTSPILLSYALSFILMILSHICNSLDDSLYRLFCIYIRFSMIDPTSGFPSSTASGNWEVFHDFMSTYASTTTSQTDSSYNDVHDIVGSSQPDYLESLDYSQLFSILYALYPINFLEFLRDPKLYASKHNFQIRYSFNQDLLSTKSDGLLGRHLAHSNFLKYTAETELTDKSRWTRLDSIAVVALCNSLNAVGIAESVMDPFGGKLPTTYEETSSATGLLAYPNESHDIASEPFSISWPQNPSISGSVHSATTFDKAQLSNTEDSYDNISHGTSYSEGVSSIHMVKGERGSNNLELTSESLSSTNDTIRRLQRELLFLQNELRFEKFVRQQHLQNIGKLHREHILDMAVESERQKLLLTNKRYKAQIELLNSEIDKHRSESQAALNRRVKWENDFNNKIKALREEKKAWKSEESELKSSIESLISQLESIRNSQIDIAFSKNQLELKLQLYETKLKEYEQHLSCVNISKKQVSSSSDTSFGNTKMDSSMILSNSEAVSDEQERELIESEKHRMKLESENLHLQANIELLKKDLEAINVVYEAKIFDLEKRLSSEANAPELHNPVNLNYDAQLSKISEIKENYDELLTRYRELEGKFLESQAEVEELKNFQKPLVDTGSSIHSSPGLQQSKFIIRNDSLHPKVGPPRRQSTDTSRSTFRQY
ncbi:Hamartin [Schizosaccharomyces pombe]